MIRRDGHGAGSFPSDHDCDLLIVGGGINGAAIARDAAGRGLSVILVEQNDLASYTSSASTKLIHGGLRYLEYGELRLVREALIEREMLWGMAPHIICPRRFILPQTLSVRPAWMIRLGLFLYDHLGGRKRLPGTETICLDDDPRAAGLRDARGKAFAYSDCWVDDSRLVVLTARDAANRGAQILTHTRLIEAHRQGHSWLAVIEDFGQRRSLKARALVNAAGPWVADVAARAARPGSGHRVRLVKGSHIVVPRLYPGDHCFTLQNTDKRIVFAIPYEDEFTLIGTTDEPWEGPAAPAAISESETDYLLETIGRYFQIPAEKSAIVWSYSGIRALHEDGAAEAKSVTRDYALDLDTDESMGGAPLLNIFGGKITTHRKLAEHALGKLRPFFPGMRAAWTAGVVLPGGDIPGSDLDAYRAALAGMYPALPAALVSRLARSYGSRAPALLGQARTTQDLGEDFGAGLSGREIDFLVATEWATSAEDILYRRSKLGLHLPPRAAEAIDAYLAKGASGLSPRQRSIQAPSGLQSIS